MESSKVKSSATYNPHADQKVHQLASGHVFFFDVSQKRWRRHEKKNLSQHMLLQFLFTRFVEFTHFRHLTPTRLPYPLKSFGSNMKRMIIIES